MSGGGVTRGQPLVALVAVLGSWVGARALVWDAPLFTFEHEPDASGITDGGAGQAGTARRVATVRDTSGGSRVPHLPVDDIVPRFGSPAQPAPVAALPARPPAAPMPVPHVASRPMPVSVAAGHQLLWMSALSSLPMPFAILERAHQSPAPFYPAGREPRRASSWSVDGWLMLRRGGGVSTPATNAPATYGASQAGAVVRYRLAPASPHRPAAYLRTTAALDGPREKEAAAGLSLRPLPDVPVTAAVEMRVTERSGGSEVRPAALVVTELPPVKFGNGAKAEAYAQAGYVGGDNATAFVDGQLKVDARLAGTEKFELRAGAGTWGGAQEGTGRLDIGPTANVRVQVGDSASAQVGVDWRFRIAGDAAPASGPAVTISAGF